MKKTFLLRLHCLLSAKGITQRFGDDNEVVIPLGTIGKLEKISKEFSAKSKLAHNLLEYLRSFPAELLFSPIGVQQKNGSFLRIISSYNKNYDIPFDLSPLDKQYLQIACDLKEQGKYVVIVTRNSHLALIASKLGIQAEGFKDELFPVLREQYTGRAVGIISAENMELFEENGEISPEVLQNYSKLQLYPNTFVSLFTYETDGKEATAYTPIARYDGKMLVKLNFQRVNPYSISPKNAGQVMALEALLTSHEHAPIVVLKGCAGTGKTFISLAAALFETIDKDVYDQIMITAPKETVAQEEYGYLPGEIENKFQPYIGGIKDNVRILYQNKDRHSDSHKSAKPKNKPQSAVTTKVEPNGDHLFEEQLITILPIGFLRGRTIVNRIFIIDEAQNIHPDKIKDILTRIGEGSKFIFLGDPTQIDNPELNERFNGLVYLSEVFKEDPDVWEVTLSEKESVRSRFARKAASLL